MTFSWIEYYRRKILKKIADLIPTPPQHCLHNQAHWWERKTACLRRAGIVIEEHVAIDSGFFILTLCEENLTIGAHSAIGARLRCHAFNKVVIGRFCMFAADVTLSNGGHDRDSFVPFSGSLSVGNGCWIGGGAHISGPLTIGDNVIVAAGAVVVDDVPSCAIVAGVPAKIIGYRTLPDRVWHLGDAWYSPHTFELVE